MTRHSSVDSPALISQMWARLSNLIGSRVTLAWEGAILIQTGINVYLSLPWLNRRMYIKQQAHTSCKTMEVPSSCYSELTWRLNWSKSISTSEVTLLLSPVHSIISAHLTTRLSMPSALLTRIVKPLWVQRRRTFRRHSKMKLALSSWLVTTCVGIQTSSRIKETSQQLAQRLAKTIPRALQP